MKNYIIYSKDWGVFLGSFLGLGIWSKLDHCNIPKATVFANKKDAEDYVNSWETQPNKDTVFFLEAETVDEYFATIKECVSAGAEEWYVNVVLH